MSGGDSVKLRLHLSSNFVSGIYTIAELLIVVAFTRFVTLILESRNVERIYGDNKSMQLTSSSLWIFADHGLTSKTLHRVAFCLSAVILTAGAIGGFAIVGVTEMDFKTVPVKNLVKRAPSGGLFDFEKHVSVEKGLIPGTVLLLRECVGCNSGSLNEENLYHYTNDLDDIASPKWPVETRLFNSTCVTKESGYEEEIALQFETATLDLDEREESVCDWSVDKDEVPLMRVAKMEAKQKNETRCRFQVLETWCFSREKAIFSCVALVRHSDGYGTSQIEREEGKEVPFTLGTFRQNELVDSDILKSMAFLSGAGVVERDLFISHAMSLLTVEENASVRQVARNRNVTEINVLLFCLTFGLSLFITTVLGIVAWFSWLFVLFLPGRLECNRFSSATDMLCYAAVEAFGDEGRMRRRNQAIAVGVGKTEPHVGPLKDPVGQGGENFREEELVGRSKRRH